ncbi:mitochondrial FAD-linked sulfhydryl oxidase [Nematocida displodere]|uniref:Sulfhydryl oxidase n=1 Tax=Nematocida displodere TaxID=1805483 RepID=A0A177EE82_9MICR|nr:mitochondrial FAD-linked sulfhydryl oxidase [Nematocida displodere]
MRKDALLTRAIVGVVCLWSLLTIYKYMRKHGAQKGKLTETYYTMPSTKEARRAELGRSTWTLLHTIASKYPAYPTREEQTNAIKLIDLMTKMFPCDECRGHFTELVKNFSPKVSSQEEFSEWLCEAHNIVNRRLGKPVFNCKRLDERWDCGCK